MLRRSSIARPRRQNSHRADEVRRCPAHLQWLRGRQCCVANADCGGRMEAAHVDHAGGKGVAIKVADWKAVPMCSVHHGEVHQGWRTFEAKHRIDLVAAAASYAAASPHREKWLSLEREARS